jgi:DNA modification methylase
MPAAPRKPAARKRNHTKTSPFGSPGRVNHDASSFYASKLYDSLRQEDSENLDISRSAAPANTQIFDQIFCKSCEQMSELPDNSVHLMVTSPPYNVGKEYDQDLTLAEYLAFLQRAWGEVRRVLVDGGRMCINVANLGRKPYIPLHAFILQGALELGFHMRGEIIWNKAASASPSTAWGSWQSAANPTLRDVHEYILVFSKGSFSRKKTADLQDTISRDEFLEITKSVWTFPTETARKVGHPAPFPVELPRRLIQLYTFAGELVLDPFMGSGQTALAALRAGRHFVGYETDPDYVKLAEERIKLCAEGGNEYPKRRKKDKY